MDPNQPAIRTRGRGRNWTIAPQSVPSVSRPNAPRLQLSGPPLTTGQPLQYGRCTIRGRQLVDTHFRLPRPTSSQGVNGKQGTKGQPLTLTTNYFPVTNYTNWSLYLYSVDFNPPQNRKNTQRALLGMHKDILGPFMLDDGMIDGTMIFSSRKYQNDIPIPEHGINLWPGYAISIGLFDNGLLMMTDTTSKIMRQDTVLDFFRECFSNTGDRETSMNKFKMEIIGAIVITTYNYQMYIIHDVINDPGINSTYINEDGTNMTYRDYYRVKWNLEIRGGNQPLLVSKKKKSFNKEEEEELIYLIPELCNMTGYSDKMRSNYSLMADLSMHTRSKPESKVQNFYNILRRLEEQPDSTLKNWDLALEGSLVKIPSRVLPQEKLCAKSGTYASGIGDWTNIMMGKYMYKCIDLFSWVVLSTQKNRYKEINLFVQTFIEAGNDLGFRLPRPKLVQLSDNSPQTFNRMLDKTINENNAQFVLLILESTNSNLYNMAKRKLCVDKAVPSQVVALKNVLKNSLSFSTKLAVQINCKLGGVPWRVNIPVKGMMIVGFDIFQDKKRNKQSYGGFVSTMDDTYTNYFSCVQTNSKGQDISDLLENCMIQALHIYKYKNMVFPTSIVIYRNGVDEGQLSHVHSTEVSKVKKCCKNILGNNFSMAFIVVTKKTSTRFFVQHKNGDATNPPPGTVVDNVVTDPSMYDFYLLSQHVTQGTATPTHYTVIQDDLKDWSVDRMQRLTYKLTHMYYNFSGTTDIPALCIMAQKLANLTATTLHSIPHEGQNELLYYL